ncbi:interferon regulatory factor 3 [Ochotona curzoniae]|uniref:interferon regulatory factor 3 n=1 Tax=Ochotona curzoniae TaxID=130825 RepID=UPI001B34700A|nr:interferon regulatory factor 3 [Ochotona curzoniae]
MGTQKPRILPWLIEQLDSRRLEGVSWVDQSRSRFRIPWKHGLRQDAQPQDFSIFQAWAEASGSYVPGRDRPDLPTWKRNFRSALNRKEVVRVAEDNSKDPHDPHKVYEFVVPGARHASLEVGEDGSMSDPQEDNLEDLLADMALAPGPEQGPLGGAAVQEYCPELLLNPSLNQPNPCPNLEPPENPLRRLLVPEEQWEFEVTAFYRGRQVFQQTIYCPWGLRLVGTAEAVNMALPGQPVALPDPSEALSDYSVTRYVRQVLGSLGGGLTLWRLGSQLCAQRLGHCHTYWAVGEELFPNSGQGPSGEVPKDREGSVFDLESFVKDLIKFINGSGHSPRYTLWFCMGEAWPQDQPWVKRLVMLKILPTCLKALLDMAKSQGASSLENTVDLHISNSQPLSLTMDQYKACLQDLVEKMVS